MSQRFADELMGRMREDIFGENNDAEGERGTRAEARNTISEDMQRREEEQLLEENVKKQVLEDERRFKRILEMCVTGKIEWIETLSSNQARRFENGIKKILDDLLKKYNDSKEEFEYCILSRRRHNPPTEGNVEHNQSIEENVQHAQSIEDNYQQNMNPGNTEPSAPTEDQLEGVNFGTPPQQPQPAHQYYMLRRNTGFIPPCCFYGNAGTFAPACMAYPHQQPANYFYYYPYY